MIYVLFGPPGVGKTYIGELLSEKYEIPFFDGDVLFDEDLKRRVRAGQFNTGLRELFFDRFQQTVEHLLGESSETRDIIVAQAFTKDKNRRDFYNHFDGQVQFIFVHASKLLAHSRMIERLDRSSHVIDEGAFEYVWREFEEPTIRHFDIINDTLDNNDIIRKLSGFIVKS